MNYFRTLLSALSLLALSSSNATASEHGSHPIAKAPQFIGTKCGLKKGEFSRLSKFIRTKLPSYIKKNKYFLTKKITGQSRTIEYDPKTKKSFILLDGAKGAFLGRGAKKVVTKAILFNRSKSQIVARGEQCLPMKQELKITKRVQGLSGLFRTIAFTQHKAKGKRYNTIYTQLYSSGSLADMLNKNIRLSIHEKTKIALDILKGLESLHKKNIVHRDLGIKNYLVTISKGTVGRRKVVAVIADLGRALPKPKAAKTAVQGNSHNVAPEGIFLKKMKGADYFATDIYAVGCAFYRLVYGERPSWTAKNYVKNTSRSESKNYKILVNKINKETKSRITYLQRKQKSSKLSKKEAFEFVTLRMVNADPKKRGTAKQLRRAMLKVCKMSSK